MTERLDQLADLGTTIVTFSGGEPLLHPDLDQLIAHVRSRGMIAGMITNGYLLTRAAREQLNDAGLDHMQISIDNVMPDEVSKKSLKVLDKKLQILSEHALFHVNINSVLGGGIHNPEDALVVGKRALELGFTSTVGIIHDGERATAAHRRARAQGVPGDEELREEELLADQLLSRTTSRTAGPATGAAARARAICIFAKTAWCTTARSSAVFRPSRWLNTRVDDIRREYLTEKSCAPMCTISCVRQISYFDFWRDPQTIASTAPSTSTSRWCRFNPAETSPSRG